MKDLLPGEMRLVRSIEDGARRVFEGYGYQEIRTPLLEFTELFKKSTGETTDIVEKEMYAFTDAGEKEIALRPEGTPSVVRAILEHGLAKQSSLIKWYYIGPMFRRERPQAGRFRQFTQVGVEAIGTDAPGLDVEMLEMAHRFLAVVGLGGVELHLNSIGCATCRPPYRALLQTYARERVDRLCQNCRVRIDRNPLRVLDCKQAPCQEAMQEAPMMSQTWCSVCRDHFDAVQRGLKHLGVPFTLAPRLVRGLDYYTRTTFEFIDGQLGAQNAVAGGGRYDDLVALMGGDPQPAMGFAMGVERIREGIMRRGGVADESSRARVFMASLGISACDRALSLASVLRGDGLSVEMNFDPSKSLKAQLRQANQVGARFAVILGDQELEKHVVMVKDLEQSVQEEVSMEHLGAYMREKS